MEGMLIYDVMRQMQRATGSSRSIRLQNECDAGVGQRMRKGESLTGESMTKLVLLRHGESIWNKENLFTGWTDVDLSDQGKAEARQAGEF